MGAGPPVRDDDRDLASTIGWATAAVALAIAILLPAGYFAIQYSALSSAVRTEAHIQAGALSQFIASTPEMWRFQELRLTELLQRHAGGHEVESARILDRDGAEVASIGRPLGLFWLARSAGLFDSGVLVGRVEHAHSLRGLFLETAGVALLGALLGATVFALLRVLPRRAQRLNDALFKRSSQLNALNQTAIAITSLLSLQDILNEIMRRGIVLTGAKASCIAFYDQATALFTQCFTQGLSEHFVGNLSFRPGGLADEAFISGSYILSNDRPDTKHKLSRLDREEGLRCFICLPLTSRDHRLGVIYFYRTDRDTFAPSEIELLTTFALLAAQAIENARLYAQVQEQARTDALTGLCNRGEFQRQLKQEEERSRRYNRPLSLLMLDIDHFKRVNDSYGHQAGDEVLRALGARLREQNRPGDHAARYGGEEFVVILPETTSEGALALAERLRAAVADTAFPVTEGRTISVTISIGVATFPADAQSGTALIAAADAALYAAKQGGRNRISRYEPALGQLTAQE